MIQLCATIILALSGCLSVDSAPNLTVMNGNLSRYDEMPTVGTLDYRIEVGDVTDHDLVWADAFIAVEDCGHVGSRGLLWVNGEWLNVVVFDCAAQDGTIEWMQQGRIIGELDFYAAQEMGFTCVCSVPDAQLILWRNT